MNHHYDFCLDWAALLRNYRKIPKISPLAYTRSFLRGFFLEGLIFGGAYLRGEICDWADLIIGSTFTVFDLFYFVFQGNFQVQAPGGLIFGGAYFRNFTVFLGVFTLKKFKSSLQHSQVFFNSVFKNSFVMKSLHPFWKTRTFSGLGE